MAKNDAVVHAGFPNSARVSHAHERHFRQRSAEIARVAVATDDIRTRANQTLIHAATRD